MGKAFLVERSRNLPKLAQINISLKIKIVKSSCYNRQSSISWCHNSEVYVLLMSQPLVGWVASALWRCYLELLASEVAAVDEETAGGLDFAQYF